MSRPTIQEPPQSDEDWLTELFEFELCSECGHDAEDHTVVLVPGLGTRFARCNKPRPEEAE